MKINFPAEPMPKINYLPKQNLNAPPPPSNSRTLAYIVFQRPQSITDKLSVAHCALRVAPFTTSPTLLLLGCEFLYAPCGHIVPGNLNIARNEKLRYLLRIFVVPELWYHHRRMWSVRQALGEKENVKLDTHSEWNKSIGDVLKSDDLNSLSSPDTRQF